MLPAGGGEDNDYVVVGLTQNFCRFNAGKAFHVNIKKHKLVAAGRKALKKAFAAFKGVDLHWSVCRLKLGA